MIDHQRDHVPHTVVDEHMAPQDSPRGSVASSQNESENDDAAEGDSIQSLTSHPAAAAAAAAAASIDPDPSENPTRKLAFSLAPQPPPHQHQHPQFASSHATGQTPKLVGKQQLGRPMQVFLRIRPALPHEVNETDEACLQIDAAEQAITCHSPDDDDSNSNLSGEKYTFTHVFPPSSTQNSVFDRSARPLLDSILTERGAAGLMFAHGITNSGKTWTMSGSLSQPGVIPLSVDYIFQNLKQNNARQGVQLRVLVSYLEIYNEQLFDMLRSSQPNHQQQQQQQKPVPLKLQNDRNDNVTVVGLKKTRVHTAAECRLLLSLGAANRRIAATQLNSDSSRSVS